VKFESRAPLSVEIGANKYEVQYPTVAHIEQMMKAQEKIDPKEQVREIREWLVQLGVPFEASAGLYMDQLTALMEELTGAKKK
jgi:hypothetical protein